MDSGVVISPDVVPKSPFVVSGGRDVGVSSRDKGVHLVESMLLDKDVTQRCDDDQVSILSFEESRSFPFLPRSKTGQVTCFIGLAMLVLGSVVIASVCGSGLCGSATVDSKVAAEVGNSSGNNCTPNPIAPSSAPVLSETVKAPSTAPIVYSPPRQAFLSTQELYDAVDEYLLTGAASNPMYGHPIGFWNISLLTNLSSVFDSYHRNPRAYFFNENLSGWDTSRVVTMDNLFLDARSFDGDISSWNTGRVTSMRETFGRATSFRGDVSRWDVSRVTTMERMFALVTNFNNDLRGWNVSSVEDMTYTFLNCFSFQGRGLHTWDTSNVQRMEGMFANTPSFNGDLSLWNVSRVRSMRKQFRQATSFNGDLSLWDVRNLTDMTQMFTYAVSFNSDISAWDVSSVTEAALAFYGAASFKTDLSSWNVRSMKNLTKMFAAARYQNHDYCQWGQILPDDAITQSLFIASGCPYHVDSFQDKNADRLTYCTYCGDSLNFSIPPTASPLPVVSPNDNSTAFEAILNHDELLHAVDVYLGSGSSPYSSVALKYGYPIGTWDVSRVTDFSALFHAGRNNLSSTFNEDLNGWNTSFAESMAFMFTGASLFNGNISLWSTERVTNMTGMFAGADVFNGDLSLWDTSLVVDLGSMFTAALLFEGKGLEYWDTSSVMNMFALFEDSVSFVGNISLWNVSHVKNISGIFQFASSFNGDLSRWDVSNVEEFAYAFSGASSFNRDLSSWNVSSATEMIGMFSSAKAFNKDLCAWGQLLDASKAPTGNLTRGMFTSSACLDARDPNLNNLTFGPYCRDCTT